MPYSDPAAYWTDQTLAGLEERTRAVYEQAWREMDAKLTKRMENFEKVLRQAEQQLQDGKISLSEFQSFLTRNNVIQQGMLEAASVLAEDMHNANLIAAKIANGGMADIYAVNANYTWYDISQQAKNAGMAGGNIYYVQNKLNRAGIADPYMNTAFTLYNHDTAEKLLNAEWSISPEPGKNGFLPKPSAKKKKELRQLARTNPDILWNENHFRSAMLQGVLQGESMTALAKRLKGVCDMNERQAIRNARTMTTNVQNQGRQRAYLNAKDKGVNLVIEWYATLDGRTRHSHRMMHGKTKSNTQNGKFPNGCRWPGDPSGPAAEVYNCRCTTVSWVKGFEHDAPHDSAWLKEQGLAFDDWQKGMNKAMKAQPLTAPVGSGIIDDRFSAQRKANALRFNDINDAHHQYAAEFASQWDQLTEEEQYSAWLYSRNSNPMNRALSGYENTWARSDFVGVDKARWGYENNWRDWGWSNPDIAKHMVNGHHDFKKGITNLTTGLDKCALQHDEWLVRGSGSSGLAGLLSEEVGGPGIGLSFDEIRAILDRADPQEINQLGQLVQGRTFKEHAFMSCGSAKGGGFDKSVAYDIYAPKGTRALYIEPTSYYGDTINFQDEIYKKGKRIANTSGGENETLLQRGGDYRINKLEWNANTGKIEVEMDVLDQPNYFRYGDEDTWNNGATRHPN